MHSFLLIRPFVLLGCVAFHFMYLPPQESVRAIGKVKVMFFMPVLQCATIVAFLVPWVVYAVFTASLAEVNYFTAPTCLLYTSPSPRD